MATKPANLKFEHLERIVDEDGGVTVSVIRSYGCIAAAAEENGSVAMLRRRPGESFVDLLQRLDTAVATAYAIGSRVDEVNKEPETALPENRKSRR